MTLFNPPIFQFYSCTKTSERVFRNFSSSNSSKFRKIHSEVRIQGKNNFEKRVPKFKIRGKNGNPRGEKESRGGMRIFPRRDSLRSNFDEPMFQKG
ncbi:hypothetical protein QL285_014108 [Trifolium repens]|nr:hypothetical protein QL285_014108 [Trifolium repens]